jgi:hypothetical protein
MIFKKTLKKVKNKAIQAVYKMHTSKYAGLKNMPDKNSIAYHSFLNLEDKVFDRTDFILNISKNKKILHFGFLDSPFLGKKIKSGELLHHRIKNVATKLHGVDIDEDGLREYRSITGDIDNSIFNVAEKDVNVDAYSMKYDLIILGEVLEHIMNPGLALKNIKKICENNDDCRVCITVPNAFSANGHAAASLGIETVHPGHYYYFSPYTIKKLLEDTGFKDIQLYMYHYPWAIISPGITRSGIIAVAK